MFAGRAYRKGFDRGCADGQAYRPKSPKPPFWRSLFSGAAYTAEYIRGYHDGYAHGCRVQAKETAHPAPTASVTERHAELARSRAPTRERDFEHSR
ncbi:hypothetical protein [Endothiovibrio diazotrophicus]